MAPDRTPGPVKTGKIDEEGNITMDDKKKGTKTPTAPLKEKAKAPEATPPKKNKKPVTITVKDLEDEFNLDGKKIRGIIRSLGFKAPATKTEGFGAKAKYEWASDSKD